MARYRGNCESRIKGTVRAARPWQNKAPWLGGDNFVDATIVSSNIPKETTHQSEFHCGLAYQVTGLSCVHSHVLHTSRITTFYSTLFHSVSVKNY